MTNALILRYSNIVMMLAFVLSAAVQYNDNDAATWVAIYGAAALCCFLQLLRKPNAAAMAIVAAIALLWALSLLPDVLGKVGFRELFESFGMQGQSVEEAREIGGLLLISGWMLVLLSATLERPFKWLSN